MIEVKTILNANLVRKFNMEQAKKRLWFPMALMLVFAVLGIVGIALKWDLFISAFLIAVGVLLPVVYWLTVRIMQSRMLKNSALVSGETTQIWRFLEDKILFNESGRYVQARDTQVVYDAIYKVTESESAFYLYMSKMQAYIIDAKGITIGTRRGLHDFLLDKLGPKKYKAYKKQYTKK